MERIKVRATLKEEILGTMPNNADLHADYIASKAPDARTVEEEIEDFGVQEITEKGMTVFPRLDGKPYIYDYQIKGFFKDSTQALRKVPGTHCSSVKAFKKEIDGLLFVEPRKAVIMMPEGGTIGRCQRPLRASTPMGERIALADSETCPEGSIIEFEIICLTDSMKKLALECLDYGILRGFGQWRNSGKGRFTYEILD